MFAIIIDSSSLHSFMSEVSKTSSGEDFNDEERTNFRTSSGDVESSEALMLPANADRSC